MRNKMKGKRGKKRILVIVLCAVLALAGFLLLWFFWDDTDPAANEGTVQLEKTETWTSSRDGSQHTVSFYSLGASAREARSEAAPGIIIVHKFIDDIPVYEMYPQNGAGSILFFLHVQSSKKEEYLPEMIHYAENGYFCVTVDLAGHGERITEYPLMALEITKQTGEDLDILLDYYESSQLADADSFALFGVSQGGSAAYWYAAYGNRTPKALVVGCTTPDYSYYIDSICFQNGQLVKPVWTEREVQRFIQENNPINRMERFYQLPILSGNSFDDFIVPYKGSEQFEKKLKEAGNSDVEFCYFLGAGHDVTDGFLRKVLPFLNKYCQ